MASSGRIDVARYTRLAAEYWEPDAPAIRCIAALRGKPPTDALRVDVKPTSISSSLRTGPSSVATAAVAALGLEGSGHHALSMLDPTLCGGYQCGSFGDASMRTPQHFSFSSCGTGTCLFHHEHAWRVHPNATPLYPSLAQSLAAPRRVVLIRPPADAFLSALRRFWLPQAGAGGRGPAAPIRASRPGHATLLKELEMIVHATHELARHVAAIPCESTLFLSYELLIRHPHEHAAPLAALLRVRETDPRLRAFLHGAASNGTRNHGEATVAPMARLYAAGHLRGAFATSTPPLPLVDPTSGKASAYWHANRSLLVSYIPCGSSSLAKAIYNAAVVDASEVNLATSTEAAVLRKWLPTCTSPDVCLRSLHEHVSDYFAHLRVAYPELASVIPRAPLTVCSNHSSSVSLASTSAEQLLRNASRLDGRISRGTTTKKHSASFRSQLFG
jgi:hypothetical protein